MKIPRKVNHEGSLSILQAPWLLAFQYLGTILRPYLRHFTDLESSLGKGALKIGFQSYVSLIVLSSAVSFATGFSMTIAIAFLYAIPVLPAILFAFAVSVLLGVLTFGVIYSIPSFLAKNRRKKMDLELPYVATHLSILAASGIPPARMFKLLEGSSTTPEVASESNEIVRDIEVFGNDIITALEAERDRSPSTVFSEILEGLVATIRSGGNLRSYLLDVTRAMMDLRRVGAKQLVESLAAFAEIYVTLLVVFPLLIIVMFSVMALVGGGLSGFSVTTLMALVTYGIIPLLAAVVLVMLDSMLVED